MESKKSCAETASGKQSFEYACGLVSEAYRIMVDVRNIQLVCYLEDLVCSLGLELSVLDLHETFHIFYY